MHQWEIRTDRNNYVTIHDTKGVTRMRYAHLLELVDSYNVSCYIAGE